MAQDDKPDRGSSPVDAWRKHIKVHPAADLFPMMTGAALNGLVKSVRKDFVTQPLVLWPDPSGELLLIDGRNRLSALERAFGPIQHAKFAKRYGIEPPRL